MFKNFLKTELNNRTAKLTDMVSVNEFEQIRILKEKFLPMDKPPGYAVFLRKEKILAIKCKVINLKHFFIQ